ncbi:MAG: heliorhodopsin HeR, partial [Dehalococcoidales bacterium]
MDSVQLTKLRKYNISMAFLHLAQAIVLIKFSNGLSLPVTTSFLNYFSETNSLKPVTETVVSIEVAYLLASFLLISAVAHFLVWIPKISTWYGNNINFGINYIRWYEYTFSASIMIIVIAMLAGIYDLISLILLFTVTGLMNLFGLLMEKNNLNRSKVSWISFVFGSVAGIIPWVCIGIYFLGSAASGEMPLYVYFVMVSIFVLFFSFALNMY